MPRSVRIDIYPTERARGECDQELKTGSVVREELADLTRALADLEGAHLRFFTEDDVELGDAAAAQQHLSPDPA